MIDCLPLNFSRDSSLLAAIAQNFENKISEHLLLLALFKAFLKALLILCKIEVKQTNSDLSVHHLI